MTEKEIIAGELKADPGFLPAHLPTGIDHAKRDHSLVGASGAEKWLACAGSIAMELKCPPQEEGEPAKWGTKCHELCNLLLEPLVFHYNKTGRGDRSIDDMINEKELDQTAIDNYPVKMIDLAKDYVDAVWSKVLKYKPKKVFLEHTVTLHKNYGMYGTADFYFAFKLDGKIILAVFDLKTGFNMVEASSPQLKYYALAVQETHPKIEFDEFWCYIYQPRAEHSDGPFRQHILRKSDATVFKKKLITGAKKALELCHEDVSVVHANLTAGPHCTHNYCAARTVCPVYAAYLNQQAGLDFSGDVSMLVPAIDDRRTDIQMFTSDAQVSKILQYRKELEKYLTALEEYAINRYNAGNPVKDAAGWEWKVVQGKARRKWIEEEGTLAKGLISLGVKDPFERAPIRGIGSIESELKKTLGLKGKGGEATLREKLSDFTTMTNPPFTLVPASDERPGINLNNTAINDFQSLEPATIEQEEVEL